MSDDKICELRQLMSSVESKAGTTFHKVNDYEQYNKINNNDLSADAKKCFKRILVLINYRERCTEELYQRLVIREKFNNDDFDAALVKAKKYDLVNDARYSEMYAFAKLQSNRGIDGIIRHFKLMKIDYMSNPKLVSLLNEYKNTELNRAYNYIKTHPSHSKDEFKGNVRKLINRGFSPSIAIKAVSNK